MLRRLCTRALSSSSAALRAAAAAQAAPAQVSRVALPDSVTVTKEANRLVFSGPLGVSQLALDKIDSAGQGAIRVERGPPERALALASPDSAFLGTLTGLVRNKVAGVTRGFLVYLRIVGIGYRAALADQTLTLKVGFAHDVAYTLPGAVRAFLPEPTLICLFGIDKNEVTQVAAKIRAIRPPTVYKGKGIRLADEAVRLKPGKQKARK